MSVNSKARKSTSIEDLLYEYKRENQLLHALLRDRKGFSASETKPIGTSGGVSAAAGSSGFLKTEGDTMIGPIAFFPDLAVIDAVDDSINISKDAQIAFTSRAIVSAAASTDLTWIHGAAFAGQILMIQGILTETFTIKHGLGNIRSFDGSDIDIVDNQNVWLVFDSIANEWAAVGGSGGGSGTGTFVSADLVADQTANLAVGNHIEFDRNATPTGADGGIVLQTGVGQANGIFELLAEKTYFLSGAVSPIKSAATQLLVAWYDVTNGVELGRRTVYDVGNAINLDNQPKAEIIFTPATDVTVELRIVANSTPANLTGFFAITTYAHIFEFSGKNGSDGAQGLDGSLNWKDSVRAKTLVDVANLAAFDVITDGITLIEGDRVLLTEQTAGAENGIYTVGVVAAGLAPLTRSLDFDANDEVIASSFVAVEEGSNSNANTLWQLITNNAITVGTTVQVWEKYAPGGAGGPDLGGGSDGIDNDGENVNDGRIAAAEHTLQLWELVTPTGSTPDYSFADLLWIPPLGNTKGRLLLSGRDETPATVSFAYSDDLGFAWTAAGAGNQDALTPGNMCYDPTGRTPDDTSSGIAMATMNGTSVNNMLRRSTDRGAIWNIVNSLNTDPYSDLEWTEDESQFIAVSHSVPVAAGNIRAIKTSPDGATWTIRTTPLPGNPLNFWRMLAYSTTLGRYVCAAANDDMMYSDDGGITWTAFVSTQAFNSPADMIYSKGQDKFVLVSTEPIADIMYAYISTDGITWEQHEIDRKRVSEGETGITAGGLTWVPSLSLYVLAGWRGNASDNSAQTFWYSHDAITWTNIHRMESFNNFGWANTVEYLTEYGKFVGIGGLVGTRTMWRTTR